MPSIAHSPQKDFKDARLLARRHTDPVPAGDEIVEQFDSLAKRLGFKKLPAKDKGKRPKPKEIKVILSSFDAKQNAADKSGLKVELDENSFHKDRLEREIFAQIEKQCQSMDEGDSQIFIEQYMCTPKRQEKTQTGSGNISLGGFDIVNDDV